MDASDWPRMLVRAREGDDEAFGRLVQQHSHRVFVLAFRMLGNEQDAEDVVQESFLRAYQQLGRFQARADFGTWLYRIAINCAVDLMRGKERRLSARAASPDVAEGISISDQANPEQMAAGSEIGTLVASAMSSLTAIERAAFTLRHHEGQSVDEISKALNLGRSAAKHAVFRAVRKLRTALAPFRSTADMAAEKTESS
jgi:RNA polymerase sigma-70 factor (ECF subfamily)